MANNDNEILPSHEHQSYFMFGPAKANFYYKLRSILCCDTASAVYCRHTQSFEQLRPLSQGIFCNHQGTALCQSLR